MKAFLKHHAHGGVLIEFAIMLPLLFLVFFGLYEGNYYINLNAKLDEIASRVAGWSSTKVTQSNINDCLIGAWHIGQEYKFSTTGQVIVSGITLTGGVYKVVWQVKTSGATSAIVTNGSGTVTSTPITFANEPQLVVVEVKYPYQAISSYVAPIFKAKTLYKAAQSVPRGGTFNPLPS